MSRSNPEIDDLVNRFDQVWQSGDQPYLFAYLEKISQTSLASLAEKLIHLDVQQRIRLGETFSLQNYISVAPQFEEVARSALKLYTNQEGVSDPPFKNSPICAATPPSDDLNLFSSFNQSELEPEETQDLPDKKRLRLA